MNKILLFAFFFSIVFSKPLWSQRKIKFNTHGQGTLFLQFGYNRSFYSKPTIDVKAENYNYTLHKVILRDNEKGKKLVPFFDMSSPQFSAKLGYFIKNKWALTFSYDRYNTFFKDNQPVNLTGTFAPNSNTLYSGSIDENIMLESSQIDIAQRKGMNHISLGLQCNDMLGRTKNAEFAMHMLYGVKLGALFTMLDYTFDDKTRSDVSGLSGLGISGEFGLRFDFYQLVFIQLGLNGGWLNQYQMKLSSLEEITAKQSMAYLSPTLSLGFSIFANSKNNCASCPQW